MTLRYLFAGAAVLLAASICGGSAYALSEGEIIRLHELCVAGDRDACLHRDALSTITTTSRSGACTIRNGSIKSAVLILGG